MHAERQPPHSPAPKTYNNSSSSSNSSRSAPTPAVAHVTAAAPPPAQKLLAGQSEPRFEALPAGQNEPAVLVHAVARGTCHNQANTEDGEMHGVFQARTNTEHTTDANTTCTTQMLHNDSETCRVSWKHPKNSHYHYGTIPILNPHTHW
jgi:hypothetical protein